MRCRGVQGVANTPYLKGFLCCALLLVAPYCVPGGIRVVSHSCSTILLARDTLARCPLWVGTPLREWTRRWAWRLTLALHFPSVVARGVATVRRGLAAWSPSPPPPGQRSRHLGPSLL